MHIHTHAHMHTRGRTIKYEKNIAFPNLERLTKPQDQVVAFIINPSNCPKKWGPSEWLSREWFSGQHCLGVKQRLQVYIWVDPDRGLCGAPECIWTVRLITSWAKEWGTRRKASPKTSGAANVQGSREDASGVSGQDKTGRKFRLYTRG